MPSRKDPLMDAVREIHPKRILELGVSVGKNAVCMITEAQSHCNDKRMVQYYGFDVFEQQSVWKELDDAPVTTLEKATELLSATGAEIHLIRGDSKVTLPEFVKTSRPMDLIYIDGGHSAETIASDWENVKILMHPKTVVVFDDYWDRLDGGCRAVIDALDRNMYAVNICEPGEMFPGDKRLAPSYLCRAVRVERR